MGIRFWLGTPIVMAPPWPEQGGHFYRVKTGYSYCRSTRRKPAAGSKATHQATAKPKRPHTADAGPTLAIKIDGEVRRVPLADLLVAESANDLEKDCRQADKMPVVFLDDLLDYPDRERWAVLEFIAGLDRYRVAVDEARFDNTFEVALALLVDNT